MSTASAGHIVVVRRKPLVDRLWIGALAWLATVLLTRPDLARAILLAAPLVIAPLALDLLRWQYVAGLPKDLFRWMLALQLPTALILVIAFFLDRGNASAALAIPWCLWTWLAAATGASHIAWWWQHTRRIPPASELGGNIALLLVAVGGTWTVIYLSGRPVMQFSDAIVQLTAVHFHYISLTLPVVIGHLARIYPGRITSALLWMAVASTMSLAVGITASPLIEIVAAWTLAAALCVVAVLQFRVALGTPAAFVPLACSAASLLGGAVLAAIYAWGELTANQKLPINLMVPTHGLAMAVGFCLLGLIGWGQRRHLEPRRNNSQFLVFP